MKGQYRELKSEDHEYVYYWSSPRNIVIETISKFINVSSLLQWSPEGECLNSRFKSVVLPELSNPLT